MPTVWGLAAPQVGDGRRILVVDGRDVADVYPELKDFKRAMVNPVVVEESEETAEYSEGCLRRCRISTAM